MTTTLLPPGARTVDATRALRAARRTVALRRRLVIGGLSVLLVLVFAARVLLAGGATALAGPIAFVGLLVPHGVRLVAGSDYARVLPFSAVVGALFVVLADTVGRVVLPPSEVQVGIMTAVVGVPAFLVLVRHGRMGGL